MTKAINTGFVVGTVFFALILVKWFAEIVAIIAIASIAACILYALFLVFLCLYLLAKFIKSEEE